MVAATKNKRTFGIVTNKGKFVGGDLLSQYATKQDDPSKALSDVFEEVYTENGLIPPLYNPNLLAQLLELNTYHYRASKTKARDTAGLGWSLEELGESGRGVGKALWSAIKGWITRSNHHAEKQASHDALIAFFRSLSPPLPIILDRAQLDFEAIGWAAIELVREGFAAEGPLTNITHIPAHTLRVHKDGDRFAQRRGRKLRWFKRAGVEGDVHQDTGQLVEQNSLDPAVRATEIMWWQNYTPRSTYYGLPDIMPALGALQGDLSRRDYNISFFENHGVPSYAVFITGDYEEGETDPNTGRTELEEAIEDHFQELAKHPHSVLVMALPNRSGVTDGQVKVEFHPLATGIEEASFRLYRQDNRDEILAAHGVPPYRAGIAETGSLGGTTAEESTRIYKQSVIEPRQVILEDLINRFIIQGAFEILDLAFKFADIDLEDDVRHADLLALLVDRGAIWPDEMRDHFISRFNLDPERPVPADIGPDTQAIEAALESLDTLVKQELRRELREEGSRESSNGHAAITAD